MRVSNKDCREYILRLEPFKGSNLFSVNNEKYYIVYSYGYHFPMVMYVHCTKEWYANSDKYSRSTSKQQSQTYPSGEKVTSIIGSEFKQLIKTVDDEWSFNNRFRLSQI